ncbi:MAG: hypothetical protein HKO66_01690 [Saprospiraceae bacterium]|nr:hypothetical protein [Bacteroidia bacterium]NNE16124.1 hypothetical protein [Saprospiraceae bacterium]NNL90922.1 hypothetical protein [Saprospiraceae bacterium]
MITKIFKALFKSGKKATESVGKSMDFIDDVLEKEYIANAVDSVKESTGNVVEKAGTIYQKTKDVIDENVTIENIKEQVDKVVDKGKEITSDLADELLDKSSTLKNVMNEGKEIIEDFMGSSEEE